MGDGATNTMNAMSLTGFFSVCKSCSEIGCLSNNSGKSAI